MGKKEKLRKAAKKLRAGAAKIQEKRLSFYEKYGSFQKKMGEISEKMPTVGSLFGSDEERPGASNLIFGSPGPTKGKTKKGKKGKGPIVSVSVLIGLPGEDED